MKKVRLIMNPTKSPNAINPIIPMDYPDPDVIRVDDTYYLVSTTMYFFPGCEMLRSHDLLHWEHAGYVYDKLDSTERQTLSGKENAYGNGMWAASLRYHGGKFYCIFVANDTHKTYLYTATDTAGPWEKSEIDGFYHDNSLLFDDDGRVYIVYGNREIYLTELNETLSGPKEGGLHRLLVKDSDDAYLGYEGSHIYKINGKYYVFFIHIPKSTAKRTESCFVCDTLTGEFVGKDVFDDDNGFFNSGIAQGGIVQDPSGNWYSIMFQDSGAVGRIPFLVPVSFPSGDETSLSTGSLESLLPIFGDNGKLPKNIETMNLRPGYTYTPLYGSDDFKTSDDSSCVNGCNHLTDSFGFKSFWQFNHEPDLSLVDNDKANGTVSITTGKISTNLVQAKNTLTQRTLSPGCAAEVTLDASALNEGDYAGLCVLQSSYGFIALTKKDGALKLVMCSREITDPGIWGNRKDDEAPQELASLDFSSSAKVTLRVDLVFSSMKDTATFSYSTCEGSDFKPLGPDKKLYFKLDHFTGARFGLFIYSTKTTGGTATFSAFKYLPA